MDEFFMAQALIEAKKAYDKGEIPIGCVVVKNGQIIGKGHNQKEEKNNALYHGEIMALNEATKNLGSWWLEDCSVYVTLEPCAMCAGAMLNARIGKLYVGTRDPRMGACGSAIDLTKQPTFNHTFPVVFGLLQDQCSQILTDFFKELRKNKKK
ncbi:MAG: tRNA adenosine(34) deaminase TadA, partial [Bacillota bacterium]|nr:tRNA adenosine(34) deaminase TadA [Bacillota bacterium]